MARNPMSTPTPVPALPLHAPDSPRESESPPPTGVQGDLEMELLDLATSLYNLGTTVVNDLTKEKDKPGGVAGKPVGIRVYVSTFALNALSIHLRLYISTYHHGLFCSPFRLGAVQHIVPLLPRLTSGLSLCLLIVALRVHSNEVIRNLAALERMSETIPTMVPMQVLVDIDNSRNPMTLTKDTLERAATENQFMNGKIHAIDVCPSLLLPVCLRGRRADETGEDSRTGKR